MDPTQRRKWKRPNLAKPKNRSMALLYCLELGMSKALTERTNLSEPEIEEVLRYAALGFLQETAVLLAERRAERGSNS